MTAKRESDVFRCFDILEASVANRRHCCGRFLLSYHFSFPHISREKRRKKRRKRKNPHLLLLFPLFLLRDVRFPRELQPTQTKHTKRCEIYTCNKHTKMKKEEKTAILLLLLLFRGFSRGVTLRNLLSPGREKKQKGERKRRNILKNFERNDRSIELILSLSLSLLSLVLHVS